MVLKNRVFRVRINAMGSKKATATIIGILVIILIFLSSIIVIPPRPIYMLLFDPNINLSQNANLSSSAPQISINEDNVYAIWTARIAENSDVYFKYIRLGEQMRFGNTINLSHGNGFSTSPEMSAYRNNVYTIWESNATDLNFKASHDNGTTFGKGISLGHNIEFPSSPQIAVYGNNVYVVWQGNDDHGIRNIYFRASNNNGTTFLGIHNVSANKTGSSSSPQIAVYGNNVYVVWQGNDDHGISNIYFRASNKNGTTFLGIYNVSVNKTGSSSPPQIAVYDNNVYVVWQGVNAKNSDVYFKYIRLGEQMRFGNTINLSHGNGFSTNPQIAASLQDIYVMWSNNIPGNSDIYFRRVKLSFLS
jgi:hypothetical protein